MIRPLVSLPAETSNEIISGQSLGEKSEQINFKEDKIESMATSSELLRKLIMAHQKDDDGAFRKVAWQLIEKERRINHHVFADELERVLMGIDSKNKNIFIRNFNQELPKDKERNSELIELIDPKKQIENLVISDEVSQALSRVITERKKSELLGAHGIRSISKILFCGPPGCGKTFAAEALASALYLPLAIVRFDAVISSYLGETASNLRRVFEFARSRPCVLFFDEFDAIGKHRTTEDEHGELKRVVNSFLQILDSFHSDTLTIAATNHQKLLDSAIWRRFDEIVMFPLPDYYQIEEVLIRQFHQVGVQKSVRLSRIAKSLVGFSHADIERIAQDAIKRTILENHREVTNGNLLAAISRQLSRSKIVQSQHLQKKSVRRKKKVR